MKTALVIIAALGLIAAAPAVKKEYTTEDGKAMFGSKKFNCFKCHGPTGVEGGIGPSFKGVGKRYTKGKLMQRAAHACPPSGACDPQQLGAIVEYLRTL